MIARQIKRAGSVANVVSVALPIAGMGLMFGAMSDGFWMYLFGFLAIALGQWLTYKKAEKANINAEVAAKTAAETDEANKKQHILMNSHMDEMKKVIAEAKYAEGIVQGKLEMRAELDATALAMAAGARAVAIERSITAAGSLASPVADRPVPVQVVPAEYPLPVEVKVVLPKTGK